MSTKTEREDAREYAFTACGVTDAMLNEQGDFVATQQHAFGIDLFVTIRDAFMAGAARLEDVLPRTLTHRTAQRWMARGKRAIHAPDKYPQDAPLACIVRAQQDGQAGFRRVIDSIASGMAWPDKIDAATAIKAAQNEQSRRDNMDCPLRLAKIEEAQTRTLLMQEARRAIRRGDFGTAFRIIKMDTDMPGSGYKLVAAQNGSGNPLDEIGRAGDGNGRAGNGQAVAVKTATTESESTTAVATTAAAQNGGEHDATE